MPIDNTYQPAQRCPSCGMPMRLARSFPQPNRLLELQTFECNMCSVAFTEEVEPKVLKTAA
jgi:hypothetical protein